jgi:hypothetical protein
MGGKALNKYGVFTERKNTEEFLRIGESIQETLQYYFLREHRIQLETHVVRCYRTKADHGDLDLLVKITPDMNINYRMVIDLMFLPKAINANGGVYSFDFQGFQVDFIPIPESKWESAKIYYSYDPLGNIMGKTYHKFGLSYGWEGLFYKYRNTHGTNSENILLTNDARRIFDFGGYDYDRYLKGFDNLEEIFRFAIESKYFDSEMFQMENLKSLDKKRNRKRGSYHLFLNYIKDNGITTKYDFNEDKESYILPIETAFPESNLGYKIIGLRQIDKKNKAIADKFNGELVMEWIPGLKGKELGMALGDFKQWNDEYFGIDSYDDYILNTEISDIRDCFIAVYNNITKKKLNG